VTEKYYQNVDYFRATAIICVVFIHATISTIDAAKYTPFLFGLLQDLFLFAVPAFFFISGFLTLNSSYQKIFQRLPRIVIPFLLFSIACQTIKYYPNLIENLSNILVNILFGESFAAYFFVFVIIYLYLLAPIFSKLQKYLTHIFLIVLSFSFIFLILQDLNIIFQQNLPEIFWMRNPLLWLPFFLFGMLFKKNEKTISNQIKKKNLFFALIILVILEIISYVFFVKSFVGYGGIIWFLYSFIACIFLFFVFKNLPKTPKLVFFTSKKSYSIYLLHIMPIQFTTIILFQKFSISREIIIQYFPFIVLALFLAGILFSVMTVKITRTLFGKYSKYIIGS